MRSHGFQTRFRSELISFLSAKAREQKVIFLMNVLGAARPQTRREGITIIEKNIFDFSSLEFVGARKGREATGGRAYRYSKNALQGDSSKFFLLNIKINIENQHVVNHVSFNSNGKSLCRLV